MTAKLAACTAVVLAVALVAACGAAAVFRTERNAERAAHGATRNAYARDKAEFEAILHEADETISALRGEVAALLDNQAIDRMADADRFRIFFNAGTVPADTVNEVADDTTTKAAVVHINTAFRRASGLRDADAGR
jgi:hypothetical protein